MKKATGEIGGNEEGAPSTWRFSVEVATAWERAFFESDTPRTRKIALRSAMTMRPDKNGVFDVLLRLVRLVWAGAPVPGGSSFRGFTKATSSAPSNS